MLPPKNAGTIPVFVTCDMTLTRITICFLVVLHPKCRVLEIVFQRMNSIVGVSNVTHMQNSLIYTMIQLN